jgi:hypothetical protein
VDEFRTGSNSEKEFLMPDMIKDFGDFVVWRVSGDSYGFDVFICSHGGYDEEDGSFKLPDYKSGKPNMYFYGPHGKTITVGECNNIIGSDKPEQEAKSIIGPGGDCWNYLLKEYKGNWFDAATKHAKMAKEEHNVLHDVLMIKEEAGIIHLKDVIKTLTDNGVKYLNYNFMACRSNV